MSAPFQALTAYGAPIPRWLHTRKAALEWAAQFGRQFPKSRVVQNTKSGPRTIWREEQNP